MTSTAPSRRRYGVLLIWCGGVAMALAGAFTLAWVKLPEWAPEWTMNHSPWVDPGVRAIDARPFRHFDSLPDPVLRWGDSIGPTLLARYQRTDPTEQNLALGLALTTAAQLTADDPRAGPYPRMREAEVWNLRADLLRIAVLALANGNEEHAYAGISIARQLRGHDLTPEVRRYLHGLNRRPPTKGARDLVVEYMRDAGDIEGLLDLLPWYDGLYRTNIMAAVADCVQPLNSPPVVFPAYDPDLPSRPWATSERRRVFPDAALRQRIIGFLADQDPVVRMVSAEAVGTGRFSEAMPKLISLVENDPAMNVRQQAVEAIASIAAPGSAQVLRRVVDSSVEPLRGAAVVALGKLRDPADFSRFLALLDDEEVAGKARQVLLHWPLTPSQRHQVDMRWSEVTGEEPGIDQFTSPP